MLPSNRELRKRENCCNLCYYLKGRTNPQNISQNIRDIELMIANNSSNISITQSIIVFGLKHSNQRLNQSHSQLLLT